MKNQSLIMKEGIVYNGLRLCDVRRSAWFDKLTTGDNGGGFII